MKTMRSTNFYTDSKVGWNKCFLLCKGKWFKEWLKFQHSKGRFVLERSTWDMENTHEYKAESLHQTWPALAPELFPLICWRAPCLLVMRTGRKARPWSLQAPSGKAARTNLNCVSNYPNSPALKQTRRMRNRGKKITQSSPSRRIHSSKVYAT